jgi:hypothetical protein
MTAMMPALSILDTITVLRERYPDGLVCIACGRLLATRRESWSVLSDPARLEYVCAGCRQDSVTAKRVHAVRIQVAQRAAQAASEGRRLRARAALGDDQHLDQHLHRLHGHLHGHAEAPSEGLDVDRNPRPGLLRAPEGDGFTIPAVHAGIRDGFLSTRSPVPVGSARRGGRPRKHPTDRAARTAAQQAWRARQKTRETL